MYYMQLIWKTIYIKNSVVSTLSDQKYYLINVDSFFPVFLSHFLDYVTEPTGAGFSELEFFFFCSGFDFILCFCHEWEFLEIECIHANSQSPYVKSFATITIWTTILYFRSSESCSSTTKVRNIISWITYSSKIGNLDIITLLLGSLA